MAVASDLITPVATGVCPVDAVGSDDDRRTIARAGLLTMAGSIYAGAAGFVLTLVVGHLFGAHGAGIFFMAVSIFTILNGIAVLGADTGLLRAIAGRRALHAHRDVGTAIRVTAVPVLAWSATVAAGLWLASGPLSRRLLPHDSGLLQIHLEVVAATLVLSAFGQSCLLASRGFDNLRPYVVVYQVGLSTTRIATVAAIGVVAHHSTLLLLAWAVPLVVMDLVLIAYVLRRATAETRLCPAPGPRQEPRELFAEIWRFNVPRGFASFFETCIVWADVLVVALFLGPAMAGAYAAASRFVTTGTMAMEAMRVGASPTIATAYARGEKGRANDAYQVSSIWLVLLSWPVFLTLAAFAPYVLGLIGPDFTTAAPALSVMSLGILGYLVLGNINSVLLMAGRSTITATNSLFTMLLNIALNLMLVPAWGLVGAAVSWSAALILDSALCLVRGKRDTGVSPPVRSLLVAAAVCVLSFGTSAMIARFLGAQSFGWLAAHLLVATTCFVVLVRRWQVPLRLHDLRQLVRTR